MEKLPSVNPVGDASLPKNYWDHFKDSFSMEGDILPEISKQRLIWFNKNVN